MTSVVRPTLSLSKDSWISASVTLSKDDVASSRIRIGGFLRNTLAMEIRCFWPLTV